MKSGSGKWKGSKEEKHRGGDVYNRPTPKEEEGETQITHPLSIFLSILILILILALFLLLLPTLFSGLSPMSIIYWAMHSSP